MTVMARPTKVYSTSAVLAAHYPVKPATAMMMTAMAWLTKAPTFVVAVMSVFWASVQALAKADKAAQTVSIAPKAAVCRYVLASSAQLDDPAIPPTDSARTHARVLNAQMTSTA